VTAAFVHETAFVDAGAEVRSGAKLWHFVHVSAGAIVGEDTSLGQNAFVGRNARIGARVKVQNNVSIYEGVTIDDDVFLGPSCVFTNVSAPRAFVRRMDELAPTRVGKGATIGANATIVCGHDVGAYAFVGAGAVVTKDVPPHALVVGNPARRIGWVSRVGRRLPGGADPCCPETGERYVVRGETCRPLEPGGSVDVPPSADEPVAFADLVALHAPLASDLRAAFERVLARGSFILGEEVTSFEREVAAHLDVPHAIGVSSGTDALLVALMALGVGPGDEVVTTPLSFFATVAAIVRLGARPVFADVDDRTLLIDPAAVERAIGPKTKAILPVHLFGAVADMERLGAIAARAGVSLVEDAAQAFGATAVRGERERAAGTLGDLGCYSFFPTKTLGALGDGGLVVTADGALADRVRKLRSQGASPKYHHALVGGNFRLDALQAAFLRAKLPHLATWVAARRDLSRAYADELRVAGVLDLPGVRLLAADAPGHAAAQLVVRVPRRDAVRAALAQAGIATEIYYPEPLHLQPALATLGFGLGPGAFPNAERACAEVLALPLGPTMSRDAASRVAGALASALRDPGSARVVEGSPRPRN
jgi:dTDP-4-amino-4,6-dideoxygalactose transaminase/acetyltransferase-like isoleucine patch superfamily enzyme